MSANGYDPRPDLASLLCELRPLWEARKLGGAESAYEALLEGIGQARLLVLGEWQVAVSDALPAPGIPGEIRWQAIRDARRYVYQNAIQFAAAEETKAAATEVAVSDSDDEAEERFFAGQRSAWITARAYLEAGLKENQSKSQD